MKKSLLLLFVAAHFSLQILAQPTLLPSIGLTAKPSDSAPICPIQTYTGSFVTSGYQSGDTIPRFKLYKMNGDSMDVYNVLLTNKPLVLIAGSYTCPVYRGKFNDMNTLVSTYASQVNFYNVYVVEAHPNTPDVSPYSGNVWVTPQNTQAGILYLQPKTYGDRKAIINAQLASNTLNMPILIDGPCNAWWNNFGPAPNNAYLIRPDGTVYSKHDWFNRAPQDMSDDIDALLALLSVNEPNTQEKVLVYPNPLIDEATVIVKNNGNALFMYELKIVDLVGKEVNININRYSDKFVIRKGNVSPGIYFYKLIRHQEVITTGKIIIN